MKINSFQRSELKYYLLISVPIAAIFFLIPSELYFNAQEYWNWNKDISIFFAGCGMVAYFILMVTLGLCFRLSNKSGINFALSLFYLGSFILLADVFSPLQTSLLDGTKLFSAEPIMYSLIEGTIFFLIIIVVITFRVSSTIRFSVPISFIFILISIGYFILILNSSKPIEEVKDQDPNINIRGNVYHIVLDAMQSDAAILTLKGNGKDPNKNFPGFLVFKNNIANYLHTELSFPSYISGTFFSKNSYGKIKNWLRIFKKEGLFKSLYEKGYRTSIFGIRKYWISPYVSEFTTMLDTLDQEASNLKRKVDKDFIQIWFARLSPNLITNRALSAGEKLGQWASDVFNKSAQNLRNMPHSEGRNIYSSVLMFERVIETEKQRGPNGHYVYVHLGLPHKPFVMDEDCEYDLSLRSTGTAGYFGQVKCAFSLVTAFIKELKRLGRYDDATIIIHGDHGHGGSGFIKNNNSDIIGTADHDKVKEENIFLDNGKGWSLNQYLSRIAAFLMIKPANASGNIEISQVPSQLVDLYPTLIDMLKLNKPERELFGISLLSEKIPKNRQRIFYYYPYPEVEPLTKITSNHADFREGNILIGEKIVLSEFPSIYLPQKGLTFDIGSNKEGRLQMESGFSGKERTGSLKSFRWAVRKNSKMIFRKIRLLETHRLQVKFRVEPYIVNRNKKMVVQTELSSKEVTLKPGWYEYGVQLNFPKGEDLILKMYYENAASPKSLGRGQDTRRLSVRWDTIRLQYVQN